MGADMRKLIAYLKGLFNYSVIEPEEVKNVFNPASIDVETLRITGENCEPYTEEDVIRQITEREELERKRKADIVAENDRQMALARVEAEKLYPCVLRRISELKRIRPDYTYIGIQLVRVSGKEPMADSIVVYDYYGRPLSTDDVIYEEFISKEYNNDFKIRHLYFALLEKLNASTIFEVINARYDTIGSVTDMVYHENRRDVWNMYADPRKYLSGVHYYDDQTKGINRLKADGSFEYARVIILKKADTNETTGLNTTNQ